MKPEEDKLVVDGDTENEAEQQPRPGKTKNIAIVLFIALLAAAGAYLYFNQQQPVSLSEQPTNKAAKPAAKSKAPPPPPPAASVDADTKARLAELERQMQQLRREAAEAPVEINLFWALSEAEYLLTIARYKVIIENDPEAALALLQLADGRLDGLWLQELEQVQLHIDNMAATLASSGGNSVQQAMVSISSLQDMFAAPQMQEQQPAVEQSTNNDEQSFWSKLWQDVASLVTIEKLSPDKSLDLRQEQSHLIRLQLIQLRGAVLHRADSIFQQLLAELKPAIMASGRAPRDQLERELDSLANTRLRPVLDTGELDSALESLRAYQRGNN